MILINKLMQALPIVASLVLFGCSSSDTPELDNSLTGQFTTPVVKGLKYTTETQSGQTDASGNFQYKEGEVIRFYIGVIYVGETVAKDIITPLDLSSTTNAGVKSISTKSSSLSDSWAVNLFNLLLSLDSNGDISDGIEITTKVSSEATSITLDLDLPPAEFKKPYINY